MSNEVHIKRTKFTDLVEGTTTFGVRMYDDVGRTYIDMFNNKSLPNDPIKLMEIIAAIDFDNEYVNELFYCIEEDCLGVFVDNVYIAWERIEHLFNG